MNKILLSMLMINLQLFSQTIDFDKLLNLTLENNKDIKTQELNVKSLNYDTKKVSMFSFGDINLTQEYSRTNHPGYVFNSKLSSREVTANDMAIATINNPGVRDNYTAKVTYDIPLFTGFKLSSQKDIMKIKEKVEQLKLSLDKKSLEFEVLKAYNAAVVAKEYVKATMKAREAVSFVEKTANESYKQGLVTKIDAQQAKVYGLNIQSQVTEAQNRFDLALAYLKFLSSSDDIDDVEGLKLFNNVNDISLNKLYELALNNRDDLMLMEQNKRAMKKNIKLNESSYYPSVYSHFEYGFNNNNITLDSSKDYYVGLIGVNFKIFDASRGNDYEKSKIEYNKSLIKLNKLKDAIKLQTEEAYLNLKAKEKILKEKEEAKVLAQEVFNQSQIMYKNQLISMTDLLKQEATFRETEASYIMASYEKSLAYGNIYLKIGKSLQQMGK